MYFNTPSNEEGNHGIHRQGLLGFRSRLILGDQLNPLHSWFQQVRDDILYTLMEVRQETDVVSQHIQKVAGFFSAMRHFAGDLARMGHRVAYLRLDDPHNEQSFDASLIRLIRETGAAAPSGCFVWDREGIISQPLPFPKRIYFILSMKRSLAIFGGRKKLKHHLVWLPTWYQARQVIRRLRIGDAGADRDRSVGQPATVEAEVIHLYRRILQGLKALDQRSAGNRESVGTGLEDAWIRSVMASDLG